MDVLRSHTRRAVLGMSIAGLALFGAACGNEEPLDEAQFNELENEVGTFEDRVGELEERVGVLEDEVGVDAP